MARFTLDLELADGHQPTDRLQLRIGSAPGFTLAQSTPAGGIVLDDQAVGEPDPSALDADSRRRTLTGDHPPARSCGTYALGVVVKDEAGNLSPIFATFARLADHPAGTTTGPVTATGTTNQAQLTWTPAAQLESV